MEVLLFFQSIRSDILTFIFTAITMCTETLAVIVISAAMYWSLDKKCGQRMLFAITTSITVNSTLKNIFKVARPIGSEGLTSLRTSTATGYSFPSGHTQAATTIWTSIMEYFRKWWVIALGVFMIVGTGLSRLYLGVHWPSDVIGGLILGVVLSLISVKLFDYIDKTKNYYVLFIILVVFGVFVFIVPQEDLVKSFGMYTGFILGYIIEDNFINFSTEESKRRVSVFTDTKFKIDNKTRVMRFLIGIVTLLAVYLGLKFIEIGLLKDASEFAVMVFDYIRYLLVAIWGVAGVPALFSVFKID